MFEPEDARRHVLNFILRVNHVRVCWYLRVRSVRDAAVAVDREGVSMEAAADDAFASQTGNVGDAGEGSAVRANRGVSRESQRAATTAFEVVRRVDTLPRATTAAVDTARCPSGPHLRARAAADPAPLAVCRPVRGTSPRTDALAVADDVRR